MTQVARFDAFPPLVLDASSRVFVLTGAGISAESGIATFRDSNGLWETFRIEDVASPEGWARDPRVVWRFYSDRRAHAEAVLPNDAHHALAELEARLGDRLFLCTQNVDRLHERAGSKRVTHMHGELFQSRCDRCRRTPFEDHATYYDGLPGCLGGACTGTLRPNICWFGEIPFYLDAIERGLASCNVFITIGSSGAVYPAAGFVRTVKGRRNTRAIYVGPEEPENARAFDECRLGTATQAVRRLFETPPTRATS